MDNFLPLLPATFSPALGFPQWTLKNTCIPINLPVLIQEQEDEPGKPSQCQKHHITKTGMMFIFDVAFPGYLIGGNTLWHNLQLSVTSQQRLPEVAVRPV